MKLKVNVSIVIEATFLAMRNNHRSPVPPLLDPSSVQGPSLRIVFVVVQNGTNTNFFAYTFIKLQSLRSINNIGEQKYVLYICL